jgi:RNA polymerase sigma-70 factor (ECF subfamily)
VGLHGKSGLDQVRSKSCLDRGAGKVAGGGRAHQPGFGARFWSREVTSKAIPRLIGQSADRSPARPRMDDSKPESRWPEDLGTALIGLSSEISDFLVHHTGDRQLGSDLAEETISRAFRAIQTLRDPAALRGWVFRIAVNVFNDHLRVQHLKRVEPIDEVGDELPAAGGEGPLSRAISRELDEILRKEVAALPERQRSVLLLHSLRSFSHSEIARWLGISVISVKVALFRAREAMRARLADAIEGIPDKRSTTKRRSS